MTFTNVDLKNVIYLKRKLKLIWNTDQKIMYLNENGSGYNVLWQCILRYWYFHVLHIAGNKLTINKDTFSLEQKDTHLILQKSL